MIKLHKKDIDVIANGKQYEEIDYQENIQLVSYRKDTVRINVYLTTGTVGTCLDHPKKGKTQLFRKNCNASQVAAIFNNPRKHTGKGYYKKR